MSDGIFLVFYDNGVISIYDNVLSLEVQISTANTLPFTDFANCIWPNIVTTGYKSL